MQETQEMQVWSMDLEDLLEEVWQYTPLFVWRILWTGKPGGLQSIGSQRDTIEVTEQARFWSVYKVLMGTGEHRD